MITTYTQLQSTVEQILSRADASNFSASAISLAESWIYRKIRAREMESDLSVTVTSGVGTLPSDFVEVKYAMWDTAVLRPRPASWIKSTYTGGASVPVYYAVDGADVIFGPSPNAGSMTGVYYKKFDPLATATNALFLANPDLFLFAALAECMFFIKDDKRIATWEAKRNEIASDINKLANRSRYGENLSVMVA